MEGNRSLLGPNAPTPEIDEYVTRERPRNTKLREGCPARVSPLFFIFSL